MWELIHCAKINLIFCKDTEPFVPGADVTVYVWPRNHGIFRCTGSNRDGLGVSAASQIIFGTVCSARQLKRKTYKLLEKKKYFF